MAEEHPAETELRLALSEIKSLERQIQEHERTHAALREQLAEALTKLANRQD